MPPKITVRNKSNGTGRCFAVGAASLDTPPRRRGGAAGENDVENGAARREK
jgi:hypothetical protein